MREPDVARERRHTLYFLHEVEQQAPVFLDAEVDMTRIRELRTEARARGAEYSTVSFVLLATARALAKHPAANAAARGRRRLKVLRFEEISGKLTLDKTVNGQRVVLSAVLPGLGTATLDEVQRRIDRYRVGDGDVLPEFANARALHALPRPIGAALYRRAVRPLARRPAITGTFSVTSLGHRPVDGFYSTGGTTITVGVGRTQERAVVRDGQLAIAPTLRLSLTFDHRVIDGAEAADLLADLKTELEQFPALVPTSTPASVDGGAADAEQTSTPEQAREQVPDQAPDLAADRTGAAAR
jgi:acetylornithine deacetylase/succinyl-diaminopimelate desuccinylase-like protein